MAQVSLSSFTRDWPTLEIVSQPGVGLPGGTMVKNPPANAGDAETQFQSLGREDPLEKEMATNSVILAWEIPWTEEPGRPQSTELPRVRHNFSE